MECEPTSFYTSSFVTAACRSCPRRSARDRGTKPLRRAGDPSSLDQEAPHSSFSRELGVQRRRLAAARRVLLPHFSTGSFGHCRLVLGHRKPTRGPLGVLLRQHLLGDADTLGPPSGAGEFSSKRLPSPAIKLTVGSTPATPVASTATVLGVTTKDSVEQARMPMRGASASIRALPPTPQEGSLIDAHANATERGCTSWTGCAHRARAAGAASARDDGLCACDCASVGGVVAAAMDAGTALVGVALVLVLLRGAASLDGSSRTDGSPLWSRWSPRLPPLARASANSTRRATSAASATPRGAAVRSDWLAHGALPAYAPQTLALGPAAIACAAALGGSLALAFLAAARLRNRRQPARRAGPAAPVSGARVGTVRGPDSSELPTISNDPRASRPAANIERGGTGPATRKNFQTHHAIITQRTRASGSMRFEAFYMVHGSGLFGAAPRARATQPVDGGEVPSVAGSCAATRASKATPRRHWRRWRRRVGSARLAQALLHCFERKCRRCRRAGALL